MGYLIFLCSSWQNLLLFRKEHYIFLCSSWKGSVPWGTLYFSAHYDTNRCSPVGYITYFSALHRRAQCCPVGYLTFLCSTWEEWVLSFGIHMCRYFYFYFYFTCIQWFELPLSQVIPSRQTEPNSRFLLRFLYIR